MTETGRGLWWRRSRAPLAVFVAVLALICPTLGDLGITWDEPAYRQSQLYMQYWFEELARSDSWAEFRSLFSPGAIHYYWQYARYGHNFHPPLAGMLANLSWALFHPVTDEYVARRLSVAILFALLAAVLYSLVRRRYDRLSAVGTVLALVLTPRLWGDAHLAGTDMPGAFFWVMATLAFLKAVQQWRWAIGFGVLVGLAFLVKFNGVLVVVPCLVWSVVYRRWRALAAMALAAPVALATIVALNPLWWHDPVGALAAYTEFMLGRKSQLPDIFIFYWGRQYVYSLPWHNAFVLMAVTVPVGILAAGGIGMAAALARARRQPEAVLLLLHLWFMPIMRMFPVPAHDGVRLFLPTFVFLAVMAGRGLSVLRAGLARWVGPGRWESAIGGGLLVLLAGPVAVQMLQIRPFYLSYYNEAIGGVRGAFLAGFEPIYWYEVCNRPFLRWLDAHVPDGAYVTSFSLCPTLAESQSLGQLKSTLRLTKPPEGVDPYVVLVTHTSKIEPYKRLLFASQALPGGRVELDGIPLVSVFPPEAVSRTWALWLLAERLDDPDSPLRDNMAAVAPAVRLLHQQAAAFRRVCEAAPRPVGRLARFLGRADLHPQVLIEGRSALLEALVFLQAGRRLLQELTDSEPPAVARAVRALSYHGQFQFQRTYAVEVADLYEIQHRGWMPRIQGLVADYRRQAATLRPPSTETSRRLAAYLAEFQQNEFRRGLDPKGRHEGPIQLVDEMAVEAGADLPQAVDLAGRDHEAFEHRLRREPEAVQRVARYLWAADRLGPPAVAVDRRTLRQLDHLLVHHADRVFEAVDILQRRTEDVLHVLHTSRYCLPEEIGGALDRGVVATATGERSGCGQGVEGRL